MFKLNVIMTCLSFLFVQSDIRASNININGDPDPERKFEEVHDKDLDLKDFNILNGSNINKNPEYRQHSDEYQTLIVIGIIGVILLAFAIIICTVYGKAICNKWKSSPRYTYINNFFRRN